MCGSINGDNRLTWWYKHSDSRSKHDFEVVNIHTGTDAATKTTSALWSY